VSSEELTAALVQRRSDRLRRIDGASVDRGGGAGEVSPLDAVARGEQLHRQVRLPCEGGLAQPLEHGVVEIAVDDQHPPEVLTV
jgi:hypothetical protein